MKKNKQYFIIGGVVLLVLVVLGAGVFAFSRKGSSSAEPTPTPTKKRVQKPVNQIPFEERPYVVMAPTANREVDVTIKTLPKAASSAEYLAEYQYGTSLGGNEQLIDLSKGVPATKQFALYSRSAGGKTSYEEDVKGGTLTLNFSGENEYALKQDWAYFDRINPKSTTRTVPLKSTDEKFEVSLDSTTKFNYVIIYNSPGAPDALSGKRLSEVYTFQASSSLAGKTADVSIEMTEAGAGKLYGWDGSSWTELESTTTDNTITGTGVELMEAYVVAE
jgi:hypothetical protein